MATSSFSIQDILKKPSRQPSRSVSLSTSPEPPQAKSLPEVTVLESSVCLSTTEEKPSRKRSRDCSSLGSSSETSGSSSEVFLSDPDSPVEHTPPLIDGRRKTKRPRTAFTTSQLKGLEYYFRLCSYPDSMGRDVISRVTGIDDARIQVWFQNRRARYRKREQPVSGKSNGRKSSSSSPRPTAPPQPHTSTLTASSQPHTPTTPHTVPSMLESYYAALAYQLQAAAYQKSNPSLPPLVPLPMPYLLPPPPPTHLITPKDN